MYLSGGNPRFLADTLRGTAVWAAVEAVWRAAWTLGEDRVEHPAGTVLEIPGAANGV